MDVRIADHPAIRLIGHAARVPLIHEGTNPHIAAHVRSLPVEEHERLRALGAAEPAGLLQVSADVDPDAREGTELTYLHGVAVPHDAPVPVDLDAIEVPAGEWAVFRTSGPHARHRRAHGRARGAVRAVLVAAGDPGTRRCPRRVRRWPPGPPRRLLPPRTRRRLRPRPRRERGDPLHGLAAALVRGAGRARRPHRRGRAAARHRHRRDLPPRVRVVAGGADPRRGVAHRRRRPAADPRRVRDGRPGDAARRRHRDGPDARRRAAGGRRCTARRLRARRQRVRRRDRRGVPARARPSRGWGALLPGAIVRTARRRLVGPCARPPTAPHLPRPRGGRRLRPRTVARRHG